MCANLKRFARAAQARRLPPSDLAARVIRFDSEGYVSSRMKRDVAMAEAPNRRRSAAAERAGSSSFLARPGLGHRDCVAGSVSYEAHSLTHAQYQSRARSLVTVRFRVSVPVSHQCQWAGAGRSLSLSAFARRVAAPRPPPRRRRRRNGAAVSALKGWTWRSLVSLRVGR